MAAATKEASSDRDAMNTTANDNTTNTSGGATTTTSTTYPTSAKDYDITDEIGRGVSGVVWKATIPSKSNETVAIKVLDLEDQDQNYLEEIRREAQTMSMLSHPNLVRYHCSFIEGSSLWVVMPYLEGGSVLNLMKWKHVQESSIENDGAQRRGESGEDDGKVASSSSASTTTSVGLDETTVATILKGTLKALDYFHRNGNIHRDVKAGNILVDANGDVKLADFGVSASSWGSGGRPRSHQTFVGTPCWMAPEVMEQVSGYDFHADIWSLGITVLELCHGHAPFAKYPPMKVLLMTLQNPPPTLESSAQTGIVGGGGGPKKPFSRALKEFVGLCLQKDPSKRPSAEKLLEHRFLKEAKKSDYIVKTLLKDIPSLGERTKQLLERDAKRREARRKGEDIGKTAEQEEAESQAAYKHGVSMWNFNLDELKAEAAAIDTAAAAERAARFPILVRAPKVPRLNRKDGLPFPTTCRRNRRQLSRNKNNNKNSSNNNNLKRKLRKKVDSSSKKKKAASKLLHRKEAMKSSRCARKWSSSRGRKRKPFVLSARRTRVYEGRWRS